MIVEFQLKKTAKLRLKRFKVGLKAIKQHCKISLTFY